MIFVLIKIENTIYLKVVTKWLYKYPNSIFFNKEKHR